MKKLIKLFCVVLIALSATPPVLAADGDDFTYEGITYTVISEADKTCETKSGGSFSAGNKVAGDVVIPETVYNSSNVAYTVVKLGHYAFSFCSGLTSVDIPSSVTSIGDHAFYFCSSLTSVDIPNSVTSIGDYAFNSCSGLTSVDIPNSVTSIGDYVFSCCSLTSIDIPSSVTSIGDYAFNSCSGLTSVDIPNSVKSIGDYAFSGCYGLTSVDIPNSVTSIGDCAFYSCNGLTDFNVANDNPYYSSNDGILYNKNKTLLIQCPTGKKGEVIIPNSVTSIGDYAFSNCRDLTSVDIPNSVTSIGDYAFSLCYGLTSVDIPNSVTSIGDYAFSFCNGLTSVDIPNSVTSIGDCAFYLCSGLTDINVAGDNSNYSSSDGILYDKNKTLLIQCPTGKKVEVIIPNSVTSIGDYAFYSCSSLTSVDIPNSVTSIGDSAFSYCRGLKEVKLGNSLETIDRHAFSFCSAITEIYSYSELPPFCDFGALDDGINKEICTLYVPAESLDEYRAADQWKGFHHIQAIVTEILLDKTEASIKVGETLQLTATVLPEDAAGAVLSWSSSDESIATVSETGLVTAVSLGTATITVSSGDVTATCTVEVTDEAGIDDVLIDGDNNVVVYTLQGVRLNISTREELSKLTPSFYIVNGKKVFVK